MEAPPPRNDVDEALNEEELISIQINAHSVKEILSELSVRLETAHQQISVLQDRKEINDINERMDKLQDQIESVATQSSRRKNNAPQSMEEVTQEINKIVLPLKDNFQKLLDKLHSSIKDENSQILQEKLDLLKKENIELLDKEYTSISQHNSLLAHIQTLYDKVSDLSKSQSEPTIIQKEIVLENQVQPSNKIPDDFLEQFKLTQQKVEEIDNRANNEKPILDLRKEFSEIKDKIEEQDEEIKECKSTLFLLGQKFNQYQNEIEGRLNIFELSTLNMKSQDQTDDGQSQSNNSDQSNIMSKIIPIISSLQEKQYQLEAKVAEQNNLIQSLQNDQEKLHTSKPAVTFAIVESHSLQKSENESSNTEEKVTSSLSLRSFENSPIEMQKSQNQILSIQSTPRDHQSFKELSRHLNENDLRVTDLENEVITLKAIIKEIDNQNEISQKVKNSESVAEMKLELEQKHNTQAQLVLSSYSSSRQSNHQTSRDQLEIEVSPHNQENNENDQKAHNILKENNIDDFTINDFGNLSKQVHSLLVRVGNLESRTPARFITPNDDILIDGENKRSAKAASSELNSTSPYESVPETPKTQQKHVTFSSTSVQTFEDIECQVVITSDAATSPYATTPKEKNQNEDNNNYQSILHINDAPPNNNEPPLDSARFESEPESNENKSKKVELRITTPVSEDISASRTPNALTPSSNSGRDKSKQYMTDHYIELINRMSNSLNDTIQTVASLSESFNKLNNKFESFISDQQSKLDSLSQENSKKGFDEEQFTTSIINQLRFEIDQRLMGLTPQVVQDLNNFAPIGVVKSMAQNFQASVDEIDTQIGQIKEFLNSLVTRNDLDAVLDKINNNTNITKHANSNGIPDTAAGSFQMRCLLCGRAAAGVTGMIAASEVARLLGTPPNSFGKKYATRNSFDGNNGKMVLTFAKDANKQKNMKKMKVATLPPMEGQSNKTTNNA